MKDIKQYTEYRFWVLENQEFDGYYSSDDLWGSIRYSSLEEAETAADLIGADEEIHVEPVMVKMWVISHKKVEE